MSVQQSTHRRHVDSTILAIDFFRYPWLGALPKASHSMVKACSSPSPAPRLESILRSGLRIPTLGTSARYRSVVFCYPLVLCVSYPVPSVIMIADFRKITLRRKSQQCLPKKEPEDMPKSTAQELDTLRSCILGSWLSYF